MNMPIDVYQPMPNTCLNHNVMFIDRGMPMISPSHYSKKVITAGLMDLQYHVCQLFHLNDIISELASVGHDCAHKCTMYELDISKLVSSFMF